MPFALQTSDWIDLGIAGSTFGLAIATVWMARASRALVAITNRQVQESISPVLRLVRIGQPRNAEMHFVNEGREGEYLSVCLENRGQVPVEVGYCGMSPGGSGRIADPEELSTPEIEPGQYREFEFHPAATDKEQMRSGAPVTLRVQYRSVTSGISRAFVMKLQCAGSDPQDECWTILDDEVPTNLGQLART